MIVVIHGNLIYVHCQLFQIFAGVKPNCPDWPGSNPRVCSVELGNLTHQEALDACTDMGGFLPRLLSQEAVSRVNPDWWLGLTTDASR